MFTFLLFTWLIGAFLILPIVIKNVAVMPHTEGVKGISITLITLLWPIALAYGCLVGWKQLLAGK